MGHISVFDELIFSKFRWQIDFKSVSRSKHPRVSILRQVLKFHFVLLYLQSPFLKEVVALAGADIDVFSVQCWQFFNINNMFIIKISPAVQACKAYER